MRAASAGGRGVPAAAEPSRSTDVPLETARSVRPRGALRLSHRSAIPFVAVALAILADTMLAPLPSAAAVSYSRASRWSYPAGIPASSVGARLHRDHTVTHDSKPSRATAPAPVWVIAHDQQNTSDLAVVSVANRRATRGESVLPVPTGAIALRDTGTTSGTDYFTSSVRLRSMAPVDLLAAHYDSLLVGVGWTRAEVLKADGADVRAFIGRTRSGAPASVTLLTTVLSRDTRLVLLRVGSRAPVREGRPRAPVLGRRAVNGPVHTVALPAGFPRELLPDGATVTNVQTGAAVTTVRATITRTDPADFAAFMGGVSARGWAADRRLHGLVSAWTPMRLCRDRTGALLEFAPARSEVNMLLAVGDGCGTARPLSNFPIAILTPPQGAVFESGGGGGVDSQYADLRIGGAGRHTDLMQLFARELAAQGWRVEPPLASGRLALTRIARKDQSGDVVGPLVLSSVDSTLQDGFLTLARVQ